MLINYVQALLLYPTSKEYFLHVNFHLIEKSPHCELVYMFIIMKDKSNKYVWDLTMYSIEQTDSVVDVMKMNSNMEHN